MTWDVQDVILCEVMCRMFNVTWDVQDVILCEVM